MTFSLVDLSGSTAAQFRRAALILAICVSTAAAQPRALGPFGGPAALVQTDPGSLDTVLAGAGNALLFRSTDAGELWEPLPFPLQMRAVLHALLIHPRTRGLYLAGVSPEVANLSGLWRSEDRGSTWRPVAQFAGVPVRSIAAFRGDPLVMAVGTNSGVFATADGGKTWSRISPLENSELQPVVSLTFDPNDSQILYAGTPHLPWKTVDGGASWQSIHVGMLDDSDIFSIVVDRNRSQRVFAGACSGTYRTLSGGAKWAKLPQSKEASYRTYALAQDPQYENVLYAGTTQGMIKSRDGGATWQKIAPYSTRSIAFDMTRLGRIYIATDDGGILRSDDNGKTWRDANRGFCNRRLTPVGVDESGALYTSGSSEGADSTFFVLPNGSEEWTSGKIPAKAVTMLTPSQRTPGTMYAATDRTLLVSRDAGSSWTAATAFSEAPLTALVAPRWESDTILAAAGSSIFISSDFGESWTERQFPERIRSVSALEPPWIAAVTESEILVSRDGATWEPYGRVARGDEIHGVMMSRTRVFIATTTGLRVSDQGRSLSLIGGFPEGNTVQAICRHPGPASLLFAASFNSILASADGGRAWTRTSADGWRPDSIRQLIVVPGMPDRLVVVTPQQGLFAFPLDTERKPHTGRDQPAVR